MVVIEITLVNAYGERSYSQNVIVNSQNEPPAKNEVQTASDPAPDHSEDSSETIPEAKENLAESENQETQSNQMS